jgi:tetratricopeptide (TPR) repeat protein
MNELRKQRALELWEDAQRHHLSGGLDRAIELYTESIDIYPTAEAYTFRGWAYSFQGRFEDAIIECEKAIEVDPSFGNPYNDIGSYLLKLGRVEEAIDWFERAKAAPRYEARHYPYMNLARVYAGRRESARAIEELHGALAIVPNERSCTVMLERLHRMLN